MKISWWQWLPIFGWRIVGVVESADDIPQRLPRNGAVLVGQRTRPKWVAFDCPCRSGHRIMLNTDKARSPYWSISMQGPLTISPSIDYHHPNRRCHYFVRYGRIQWVHDRGTIYEKTRDNDGRFFITSETGVLNSRLDYLGLGATLPYPTTDR